MFGDRPMHPGGHGICLDRHVRQSQGPTNTLDLDIGAVHDVAHLISPNLPVAVSSHLPMSSRAEAVEAKLHALLEGEHVEATGDLSAPSGPGSGLTGRHFLDLLETLYTARHLDLEARALKEREEGYYTIASSGHECNAAIAAALRPTDPAFLHYRSCGFFIERARQVPGHTPIFDILLSLTASSDDPISGGRHKASGSIPLWIYPQTSTIASHFPKAVGHAISLERAKAHRAAPSFPGRFRGRLQLR